MRSKLQKIKRSMANRLLRVVFGFYVVVVICLMIGQMVAEYQHQRNNIRREFVNIQTSFEHVLAGAMWNLDEKSLRSTVEGMIELPVIVGMKITDENGKIIVLGGTVNTGSGVGETGTHVHLSGCTPEEEQVHRGETYRLELFEGEFPIIYPVNQEPRVLGRATIYSDSSVVLNRVKVGFYMLGVKTIIEIGVLWLIFNLVFVRLLKRPLAELTTAVERVTLDNLDAIKVSTLSGRRDELGVLAESFNKMLLDLRCEITERKQAEEALRESEERFRCLSEVALEGLMVHEQGTILDVNRAFVRIFGYEHPEELIGKIGPDFLLTPESQALIRQRIQQWEQGVVEVTGVRKDGTTFVMETESQPIKFRGRDTRIVSCRDITKRKRAEQRLAETQSLLFAAVEQSPAGILIADAPDVSIRMANPAALGIRGEVNVPLTSIPASLHPQHWQVFHLDGELFKPEDLPLSQAVLFGKTSRNVEAIIRRPDGDNRRVLVNAAPVHNAQGEVVAGVVVFSDVTERQQAVDALRERETQLRVTLESTADGILTVDNMGKVVQANRRFLELWQIPQSLLERRDEGALLDFVQCQLSDPDAFLKKVRALYDSDGEDMDMITFKDGRFFERHSVPMILDGIRIGRVWSFRDITEQMRAREVLHKLNAELEQRVHDRTAQLRAANHELEAFSYSVSHDLRAPLRAMDGFSAALMEDHASQLDATGLDHLRRIRAGSQRMAVLIDDLLHLSRQSRVAMQRERVDVTALVHAIGAELQAAQPDHHPEWLVAPAMAADADPRMLRVVLTNLLENAWKFSSHRAGARIEVGVLAAEEALAAGGLEAAGPVFFVRDNGVGFDMAYAGKLFGAFQRLHSQQEFEGTGIGLALVQRIIRRHGGQIWATAKVNEGATFYFTLGHERS